MRNRSGIILIEDGKLALIERYRAGIHYYAFPGGGIDEGESPEQAAIREAEEELGIVVEVRLKLAEVFFSGSTQFYFLTEKLGGKFGTGTGEEFGEYNPIYGSYLPLWMPLVDIPNKNILPRKLADFVFCFAKAGWPASRLYSSRKSDFSTEGEGQKTTSIVLRPPSSVLHAHPYHSSGIRIRQRAGWHTSP